MNLITNVKAIKKILLESIVNQVLIAQSKDKSANVLISQNEIDDLLSNLVFSFIPLSIQTSAQSHIASNNCKIISTFIFFYLNIKLILQILFLLPKTQKV